MCSSPLLPLFPWYMGVDRNVCQSRVSLNAGTAKVNLRKCRLLLSASLELIAAKIDVVGCTICAITAFVAVSQSSDLSLWKLSA